MGKVVRLKLRPFGSTGLKVSPLGLGTVKLGRDRAVKYPEPFSLPGDAEAASLLALAADLGINLIDTAPAYGHSEARLGRLLAGQRQRWVICTKVGEEFDPASGESRFDFSPGHVRMSVERSLRRLNTDRIDIVLVHSDGNDDEIIHHSGALETLARLREEGKLVAYGVSTKTVAGGIAALEASDCVMATYHPGHVAERPVLDRALALGRGVLIKKALSSGHLGNGGSVAERFRFINAHQGVHSIVIGTINPDHLRANAEIWNAVEGETASG